MNTNNADTTGLRGIPRAKALIACAEAQDAGKKIQLRGEHSEKWVDANHRCDFGDLKTNYRVKPEPVLKVESCFRLVVTPEIVVGDYETRIGALDAAHLWAGAARIDTVTVFYRDGMVVGEIVRNSKGDAAHSGDTW